MIITLAPTLLLVCLNRSAHHVLNPLTLNAAHHYLGYVLWKLNDSKSQSPTSRLRLPYLLLYCNSQYQ